jgi:sec-independent protein translocase protein TatB
MFEIGWTEMAVVALIALVVIGPKDLPGAMRTVGHWVRKIRLVARDFQSNLDDMIRESELDEARKAVETTKAIRNPAKALKDSIDPEGELEKEAKDLEKDAAETKAEANRPASESKPKTEAKPASDEKPAVQEKPAEAEAPAQSKKTA